MMHRAPISTRQARQRSVALAASFAAMVSGLAVSTAALAQPTTPDSVLPGRPDAVTDLAGEGLLDPAYVSAANGISVRPPAGGKLVQLGGNPDELVRFVNDEKKWQFVVSRVMLSEPLTLGTRAAAATDKELPPPGFADTLASQMPSDTPGKLLRSDLQPINGNDGAILASRFSEKDGKRLMQQAIVRKTDKTYYVLTYTTALGQADIETDPAAAQAMAVFAKIIDSTNLLDQDAITRDQTERLIRTRALMVNWTPAKLQKVIVPEQWLRLVKDGKDIGYTYIVEEAASDLPRTGQLPDVDQSQKQSGIRIGVRSRSMPDAGFIVDAESWMWVRADRKQETFRNLIVSTEGTNKPNFAMELGTSVNRDRIIPIKPQPGSLDSEIKPGKDERIELQIWSSSNRQQMPPMTKEVPPFYLPQALAHLLPRILPLNEPRTYVFANYVSERRGVMMRYVDVLPARTVKLGDKQQVAIPVEDRAGLEGSVTTHYVSPDGIYLGSVNEDAKITILSTDAATLRGIWKDAKLERPAAVDETKKTN